MWQEGVKYMYLFSYLCISIGKDELSWNKLREIYTNIHILQIYLLHSGSILLNTHIIKFDQVYILPSITHDSKSFLKNIILISLANSDTVSQFRQCRRVIAQLAFLQIATIYKNGKLVRYYPTFWFKSVLRSWSF